MKEYPCDMLERGRVQDGQMGSDSTDGNNGVFFVSTLAGIKLRIIASDGCGWEHVSVTVKKKRTPTWGEMQFVKDLFWQEEEAVVQFHAPRSRHINNHNYCLHLWRPIGVKLAMPPLAMV